MDVVSKEANPVAIVMAALIVTSILVLLINMLTMLRETAKRHRENKDEE